MMDGLPRQPDMEVVGAIGREDLERLPSLLSEARADVLVDFTTAEAAPALLRAAADAGVRPVSGTTGLADGVLNDLDARLRARGIGGIWAPNFAVGAVLAGYFARLAARFMDAAEIVEMHHSGKADAPSGTAVATARAIRAERSADLPDPPVQRWTLEGARGAVTGGVRIHSVRLPGLVAHQETLFGGPGELLTIRHDAFGRDVYVPGVARAARAALNLVGLTRGLDAVLGLSA